MRVYFVLNVYMWARFCDDRNKHNQNTVALNVRTSVTRKFSLRSNIQTERALQEITSQSIWFKVSTIFPSKLVQYFCGNSIESRRSIFHCELYQHDKLLKRRKQIINCDFAEINSSLNCFSRDILINSKVERLEASL